MLTGSHRPHWLQSMADFYLDGGCLTRVAPVLNLDEVAHPRLRVRSVFSREQGILRANPAPRFPPRRPQCTCRGRAARVGGRPASPVLDLNDKENG